MWASVRRVLQSYRCGPGSEARAGLRQWYATPLGQSLATCEQQLLDETLYNLFGYHLLQVGAPQGRDLTTASRIAHRMVLVDTPAALPGAAGAEGCAGLPESLPLATDSIDLLLLPHVLAFADEPHQVLREAERVLIPEGHVAVLGFNPWSLWGLCRLLLGWRRRAPWCGRFLSPWRVKDWLSLLGFDTVLLRHAYHRPPLRHPGLLQRLQFLERWGGRWWPVLGGAYLLVAKKRVATLTPIRPRWRPRRALVSAGLAGPTVRKQEHDGKL
ncbi:class I SAM-dependent methyltransferase [Sulfurivermis fontis]|uniref:class I SAM-dependent methyltransferase n=1 Tax=Sulfurivermis fontis TaxID=1972068 RepID=UPI000FDA9ADA|nr:methyltransferase domain-containing protein [Sulfurivermis fontis]